MIKYRDDPDSLVPGSLEIVAVSGPRFDRRPTEVGWSGDSWLACGVGAGPRAAPCIERVVNAVSTHARPSARQIGPRQSLAQTYTQDDRPMCTQQPEHAHVLSSVIRQIRRTPQSRSDFNRSRCATSSYSGIAVRCSQSLWRWHYHRIAGHRYRANPCQRPAIQRRPGIQSDRLIGHDRALEGGGGSQGRRTSDLPEHVR